MAKRLGTLFAFVSILGLLPQGLLAQSGSVNWPVKPLRLIVAFGAGGPPDTIGRILANSMAGGLGQPIVVENRVGAAGTIGTEFVANASADGYTLLLAVPTTMAIAPSLYPKLGYEPKRDFAPIGLAAIAPFIVVVHASMQASTVKDLLDLVKSRPGQFYYGSSGNGTPLHIAGEMFKAASGIDIVHVPYKDVGPATNDFIAGRFQIMFQNLAPLVQHIRAGKVRPLMVANSKRLAQLPDVPSNLEAGLPGFDVSSWFGFVVRRGSPAEAIERMNGEMRKALAKKEVVDTLHRLGYEPAGGSAEQFAAFMADEAKKWSQAVKTSGAKID